MFIFVHTLQCINFIQLMSYAEHGKSVVKDGIGSVSEIGSSVFVFGNGSGDYCIFDEAHHYITLKYLLWSGFFVVGFAGTLIVPFLVAYLYEKLKEKMEEDGSNLRYFVWSTIFVVFLIVILTFVCDTIAISSGVQTSAKNSAAFTGYVISSVLVGIFVVFNCSNLCSMFL